jgi:hypothetical protein
MHEHDLCEEHAKVFVNISQHDDPVKVNC